MASRCAWMNAAVIWVIFTALLVYCGGVRAFHLHGWHLAESAVASAYVCCVLAGLTATVIDYFERR